MHYLPVYWHPWYRGRYGYADGLCPEAEALLRTAASRCPCFPSLRPSRPGPVIEAVKSAGVSFPAEFEIGGRAVGGAHPTYVIAEAGANHNRDLGVARELIDVAADAGADAVKFQTYSGDRIYSRKTPQLRVPAPSHRQVAGRAAGGDLAAARMAGASSPTTRRARRRTSSPARSTPRRSTSSTQLDVPVLKIASFEIVDLPLIAAAAATGRPLIISTGMAVLGEVEDALAAARRGRRHARSG